MTKDNVEALACSNRWLVCPQANPQARLRLLCLPFAGGGVHSFRGWAEELPPEVELWSVQLPGREVRIGEDPLSHIEQVIEPIAEAMGDHFEGSFALFGHSMGALIAFELARQLRRLGAPQALHLFVSGHGAPQLPDPDPPIHDLPEAEFIKEVSQLNGTPPKFFASPELVALMLPSLRADFALCETYVHREEPPLECPISAYGGLQDPELTRSRLDAWRDQTDEGFVVRMFPGDHFYIQTARRLFLQMLGRELLAIVGVGA
jgi:medium-chain acyl-[acyl-carrier-protein] hydrolase